MFEDLYFQRTYVGISSVLMSEHGLKVSKSSVPNLLKEIEFKKRGSDSEYFYSMGEI